MHEMPDAIAVNTESKRVKTFIVQELKPEPLHPVPSGRIYIQIKAVYHVHIHVYEQKSKPH